jgi:hypothetical protein
MICRKKQSLQQLGKCVSHLDIITCFVYWREEAAGNCNENNTPATEKAEERRARHKRRERETREETDQAAAAAFALCLSFFSLYFFS